MIMLCMFVCNMLPVSRDEPGIVGHITDPSSSASRWENDIWVAVVVHSVVMTIIEIAQDSSVSRIFARTCGLKIV